MMYFTDLTSVMFSNEQHPFCLCIQWTWLNSNSEASAVFLGLSELLAVLLAHG